MVEQTDGTDPYSTTYAPSQPTVEDMIVSLQEQCAQHLTEATLVAIAAMVRPITSQLDRAESNNSELAAELRVAHASLRQAKAEHAPCQGLMYEEMVVRQEAERQLDIANQQLRDMKHD